MVYKVYSLGGRLLTSTEDIIKWWKEKLEYLHNFTVSSVEEAQSIDEGDDLGITRGEVTVIR